MCDIFQDSETLSLDGIHILYNTISLVFQSFFYGFYAVLIMVALHVTLKKGLKSRSTLFPFTAMLASFVLSSTYFALQIADEAVWFETYFIHRDRRNTWNITDYSTVFNAVSSLNLVFVDAIVVWRAWVLCKAEYGKVLYVPVIFLVFTTVTILSILVVKIMIFVGSASNSSPSVNNLINILQVATLTMSLLSNIASTAFISFKTWQHRAIINAGLRDTRIKTTKTARILVILIESGVIYTASGVSVLVATLIRLPFGTLGDIYLPIHTQIAGIYPTVVIVSVALDRTLDNDTYWQSDIVQTDIRRNDGVPGAQESFVVPSFSNYAIPELQSEDRENPAV